MSEKQPQVEADQLERDEEVEAEPRVVSYRDRLSSRSDGSDSMAGASGLSVGVILTCQGDELHVRPQPPGVWTAISNRISKTLKDAIENISTEGIASLVLLNEIKDSTGSKANEIRANAVGTAIKQAIPRIIDRFASEAPDVLADVVAMILEPDPIKIKNNQPLRYSAEYLKWNVPVGEQITAVCMYIDSMNIEELAGKVTALLPTATSSVAGAGTRS